MRRLAAAVLTLLVIAAPGFARTKRKSSHARHRVSRSRTVHKGKRRAPAASRAHYSIPPGPTPERYRDIQQALADKGYYKGEVNGQWSPDSAEALKRFQAEQNLTSDGKLNSLSLIALGLGPKRTVNAPANPPPGAPKQETQP